MGFMYQVLHRPGCLLRRFLVSDKGYHGHLIQGTMFDIPAL